MTDYARLVDGSTIEFRRHFEADASRVWKFLTDPEKRERWFCGGEVEPRKGGKIVFDFDHRRLSNSPPPEKYADEEQAYYEGEVLVYDPPYRLAFTWPEEYGEGTRVEIELTEAIGGGTDMVLVHRKLANRKFRIGAMAGWHAHFDLLEDALSGRSVRDFWPHHMALEGEYESRA